MDHILVTGGAGFLGSHLCDSLLADGADVICVDNFFSSSKDNIRHLIPHSHFELIRHDIIHPLFVEVNKIYHFACPASPIHYQHNAIKTIKTNVMGTINMLGLAKRVKSSILLASTSEIYGDPEEHPQKEEYRGNVNPIGLRSCYDEGKRVAETLMTDYNRQNKVDTKIVRIFNTYGPRMALDDGRVISNFIIQALNGKPLEVNGDGSQTRSFCYVSDMVRGLKAVMNAQKFPGPINLGNPQEITILELAKIIIDMTKSSSKIAHKPLPPDDPGRRCPDISLAKKSFGWKNEIDLDEGLQKTIAYFKGKTSLSK